MEGKRVPAAAPAHRTHTHRAQPISSHRGAGRASSPCWDVPWSPALTHPPLLAQHSTAPLPTPWASHLLMHPQLPDAPGLTLGPGTQSIHPFPRSQHPVPDTPTHVRQRLRSHREMTERGFNRDRTGCVDQVQTSVRQIHMRLAPFQPTSSICSLFC